MMKWKYWRALKSFLWGIVGFFVSTAVIKSSGFFLFGYPLYALSLLMFILAIWQFYRDNYRK